MNQSGSRSPGESTAETLARLALGLVRIPSPSGGEREIADFVEGRLRDRSKPSGLRRIGDAVVASWGGGIGAGVVLGGHLDTVPRAGHPEPALRDGSVIGLGATDMKGALAVLLLLAERLHERPAAAPPVTLVLYDHEEALFERNGLRRVLAAEPGLARAGAALLLEPTDNALELGCLGTMSARVTFQGVAAHSARPWLGENAIHKAGAFLAALGARPVREVRDGPAVFREILSATLAEGGTARNVVPDRFAVTLNFRFAPDRTLADAEACLRAEAPAGASVEILDAAPAAPARADAPLFRALAGEPGMETRAKQAWTDVAQFALLGVPAANLGPGVPALAHRVDESVPVANLVRCHDILTRVLFPR